jgi:hypothetical protein
MTPLITLMALVTLGFSCATVHGSFHEKRQSGG